MLEIVVTSRFKRQLKLCRKRGWDMSALDEAVTILQTRRELPDRYRAHALSGDRAGQFDCHIRPDWVLIYRIREEALILQLLETGTHADLGLS